MESAQVLGQLAHVDGGADGDSEGILQRHEQTRLEGVQHRDLAHQGAIRVVLHIGRRESVRVLSLPLRGRARYRKDDASREASRQLGHHRVVARQRRVDAALHEMVALDAGGRVGEQIVLVRELALHVGHQLQRVAAGRSKERPHLGPNPIKLGTHLRPKHGAKGELARQPLPPNPE